MDKITTKAQFDEWFSTLPSGKKEEARSAVNRFKRSPDTWWDLREAGRLVSNIYETTSVLDNLNRAIGVFGHISAVDRELVAYTPDRESGENDRQVRLSIGRLLARAYPALGQNDIRTLIEQHQAEANTTVEFLSGTDIAKAYIEFGSSGLNSCMTGERQWGNEEHPALVYDAPGVKLAVLRDGSGKLIARCLVYEEGDRKDYVRVYGAPKLLHWLEKNGYKLGSLTGVKLKKIPSMLHTGSYVMPYLDYKGGITNGNHCSVAIIGDHVQVLTADMKMKLAEFGIGASSVGPNGYYRLPEVDMAQFAKVDELTGESVDTLNEQLVKFYTGGRFVYTQRKNVPDTEDRMYINSTFVMEADTIVIHGRRFVNDAKDIQARGYVRLDATLYPDRQNDWFQTYEVEGSSATGYFLRSDSSRVVVRDKECNVDVVTWTHNSKLLDKKNWVKLTGLYQGQAIFAAKDVEILRTPKGAKVHRQVHELCDLYDGTVDYLRGKKRTVVLGTVKYYDSKNTTADKVWETTVDATFDAQVRSEMLTNEVDSHEAMLSVMGRVMRRVGTGYFNGYHTLSYWPEELKHLHDAWRSEYIYTTSTQETRKLTFAQLRAFFRTTAGSRWKGDKDAQYFDKKLAMMDAEANAVEAPAYLIDAAPEPERTLVPLTGGTVDSMQSLEAQDEALLNELLAMPIGTSAVSDALTGRTETVTEGVPTLPQSLAGMAAAIRELDLNVRTGMWSPAPTFTGTMTNPGIVTTNNI